MKLYTAFDLHANNSYAAIIDQEGHKVAGKKLINDPQVVLEFLKPHQKDIMGIVVESTFNWYWLVDNLMDCGYKVHLANTTAIRSLNETFRDKRRLWLAELLNQHSAQYIYRRTINPGFIRKRSHL